MVDEIMDFNMDTSCEPIIKIIGVGGGGSNAVEYMYRKGINDVEFVVCNTDSMALEACSVPNKIQLGITLSQGNGAGNNPMNGEQAAIENIDDVIDSFSDNTRMIFLTAGMGGGTGTGATPVIAKAAKAKGILTVAIVTIPFRFEGPQRIRQAVEGISRLSEYVDSLLVIDNEKLKLIYGDLSLTNAFGKADDIVANAARGISELITLPGYVNVDFEDVKTVMKDSGVAVMGAASTCGEDRALEAIKLALESPLLDNSHITGAQEILLNIVSGVGDNEISMDEVTAITDHVLLQVGGEAQVIWGVGTNPDLLENISVTIVATGFEAKTIEEIVDEPYVKDIPRPKTLISQELETMEESVEDENDEVETTVEEDKEDYIQPQEVEESKLSLEKDSKTMNAEGNDRVEYVGLSEEENTVTFDLREEVESLPLNESENKTIDEIDVVEEDNIFEISDNKGDIVAEDKVVDDIYSKPVSRIVANPIHEKSENKHTLETKEEDTVVVEEIPEKKKDIGINNKGVLEEIKKSKESAKLIEPELHKSRNIGEVYYGEVVMKPEMGESSIRKIENQPAYKRRKVID